MSAACHLCGGALVPAPGFAELARVTSDCRPWPAGGAAAACTDCGTVQKVVDDAWRAEAWAIYGDYDIYFQSGGGEHFGVTADLAQGEPRSLKLLTLLKDRLALPDAGRTLDVGCGNGDLLANFRALMPDWSLAGHEMSERRRAEVERVTGAGGFHTGALADIGGAFDLITLCHVLEHVEGPAAYLAELAELLAPGGRIAIQVPDFAANPFDLATADHCSHFTAAGLARVVAAAGLADVTPAGGWLYKELTLVAAPGQAAAPPPPEDGAALLADAVRWLAAVRDEAAAMAESGSFGVFGTGPAGAWLDAAIGGRAAFFVDEDARRAGREFHGRPVLEPADAAAGSAVYLANVPEQAAAIAARLGGGAVVYRVPPAWPPE